MCTTPERCSWLASKNDGPVEGLLKFMKSPTHVAEFGGWEGDLRRRSTPLCSFATSALYSLRVSPTALPRSQGSVTLSGCNSQNTQIPKTGKKKAP